VPEIFAKTPFRDPMSAGLSESQNLEAKTKKQPLPTVLSVVICGRIGFQHE
jgi:hypothetical protein